MDWRDASQSWQQKAGSPCHQLTGGRPAWRGSEWRAVLCASAGVDGAGERCGRGLQLSASGEPPHECPVTRVAALAKAFKFRQDRLLRYLLSMSVSAHRLSLRADGAREAIDQLVSDCLGTLNRRGRTLRMGQCLQIANFVDRKFRVWIGQANSVETEFTDQCLDLHTFLLKGGCGIS